MQWPIAACSGGQAGSAAGGVAAGIAMPGMACMGMDSIGIGEAEAAGGIVQCPIATCSEEHAGVAGSTGLGVQWPMAACSGGQAGSAAGGVFAGIAMPDMACIGMDPIGLSETDAAGGIVQCPIAACSGEHAGVAGLAGLGVQ